MVASRSARWWLMAMLAAVALVAGWWWRAEELRSEREQELARESEVRESGWRDVARDWAAVMPTVHRARELAVRGERADAQSTLDAALDARVGGTGHVAELESFRLQWERWVLAGEDEATFAVAESLSISYDDRTESGAYFVDRDAAFDALAVEVADGLRDPQHPERGLALRHAWAIGEHRGDWEDEGVELLVAQGVAKTEAVLALCSVRLLHVASDELDAWFGRARDAAAEWFASVVRDPARTEDERVEAAWCLRQLADLPVALTGANPMDPESLRGEAPDRIAAAYDRVRDSTPAMAFRERLEIATEELHAAVAPSGAAAADDRAIWLLVQWIDLHVGRSWIPETSAVVRPGFLDRVIETFDPDDFQGWLAARAGVAPDASAMDLLGAMTKHRAERGLIHHLLLLRAPEDAFVPTWGVTWGGWGMPDRWRAVLEPAPEQRSVHLAWLVLHGTEWVETERFSRVLTEGETATVRLAEEQPWHGRSALGGRLPGVPTRRADVPADEASGELTLEREDGRLQVKLAPFEIVRRQVGRFGREEIRADGRVPFVVPRRLPRAIPEWALLAWADEPGATGDASQPWRAVLPEALSRVARAVEAGHESWRTCLPIVRGLKLLPTPEAAPALRQILPHAERAVATSGSTEIRRAARDVRWALLLAGDVGVLRDDTAVAEARTDLFVGTDELYWAQVIAHVDDARAREVATECLSEHFLDDSAAALLRAAESSRPGIVPAGQLARAERSARSRSLLSAIDGKAWRAATAALLAVLIAIWLLRRAWWARICGGAAPLSAYWALVIGLVLVAADVRFGYVDFLPDALGLAIAAVATWFLADTAPSSAARWGSRAFAAAGLASVVADVLRGPDSLDILVALLCATGIVTVAPLAADLVRELVPESQGAPRRAVTRGRVREWVTAIGAAVLVLWIVRHEWSFLVVVLTNVPFAEALPYLVSFAARLAIIASLAAGLLLGRAALRRGSDMTALPLLFVVGFAVPIAFHAGRRLADPEFDGLEPFSGAREFAGTAAAAALLWCALRLLDAVRIRCRADRAAATTELLAQR